jgi:hypothetical protein
MACNNCKDNDQIPQHSKEELAFAFLERMVKRLWIALIICIALIFASNAAWLYCWMQYDYSSEETIVDVNSDDGGNANYIGNDGDIVNGESDRTETEENQNP